MKKVLTIALGTVLALGILTGCKSTAKTPSTQEVMDSIKNTVELTDMREGDEEKLEKYVGVKKDDVEEFSYYMPTTNLQASQVAVIKVKDESKVDSIKEEIESTVNKNGEDFKGYLPDEYFLVENKAIESERNYILLAVSKDADKIEQAFEDALK
ncbi:MAG: DUF4358 domain-containing protein [Clostridium sp.]